MLLERLRPPLTAAPLEVWAVEDTAVQVTWGALPAGPVTAEGAGRQTTIEHPGGPGAIHLDDLSAGTVHDIEISWAGRQAGDRARQRLTARTLAPPPGAELFRFATISDLHIGARRWGFLKTMAEPSIPVAGPHPERAARAAINEALHWGAELIIIKGDAAHHRHPDNFAALGRLLDEFPEVEFILLPGNHDVDDTVPDLELPLVGERRLAYETGVVVRDVAGVRLIGADTTKPGAGDGTLTRVAADIADAVAEADGQSFVALHHHLHRFDVLTHWPPGITKPEADALLGDLSRTGQRVMLSSGHSHRNRARRLGDVAITEVASTKDWPGVWAGYAVHDGGIRQVVRRIAADDTVGWHEYSRGAVLGLWSPYASGNIDDRSITTAS